ncbi:helix-turn-helix transcriptional regulator [Leekyejoonella antrihumi]|uniref:WYL domain-containing protein n=1 Tax=Leekyejoonella antrihumi TaxID=1660198 RepID=A0A563E3P1_9MICO|nr:WYL domain-containing protein [Leekyejoonella antrihumi]TWP36863.1 WYL domain-containing protein [Leekyejoonella antrihumi]
MSSSSPAAKTERLLNLVICLLYTRQPLSKQRIRDAVPQYGQATSDESFDRMFERDKDELRDLGIPLRTEPLDPYFDDEPGYRIDRREYALPEIAFEQDELAVLGLASRTWQQASLAGAAATAMRKLEAADVERDTGSIVGLEPRVRTSEPAFGPVKDAVLKRQAITFSYRKAGGDASTRHLQPWAVTNWHGRWYVTGYDQDRAASRAFRLGRIDGRVRTQGRSDAYDIPADHDPVQQIAGTEVEREPQPAVLRVRAGAGNALRRRARTRSEVDDDWSQLDVDFADAEMFADEIAEFGPAVRVIDPPELIDAVVRRLTGARDQNLEA